MPKLRSSNACVVRTERGLCVSGTRITLYDILAFLKDGWSPTMIKNWLKLTDAQLKDVLEYLAMNKEEVEAEFEVVSKRAKANRSYWETRNRESLERWSRLPVKAGQEQLVAKLAARKAELGLK